MGVVMAVGVELGCVVDSVVGVALGDGVGDGDGDVDVEGDGVGCGVSGSSGVIKRGGTIKGGVWLALGDGSTFAVVGPGAVGLADGLTDGLGDGLGPVSGVVVGSPVGWTVGLMLGLGVGLDVGLAVGLAVGLVVGLPIHSGSMPMVTGQSAPSQEHESSLQSGISGSTTMSPPLSVVCRLQPAARRALPSGQLIPGN